MKIHFAFEAFFSTFNVIVLINHAVSTLDDNYNCLDGTINTAFLKHANIIAFRFALILCFSIL